MASRAGRDHYVEAHRLLAIGGTTRLLRAIAHAVLAIAATHYEGNPS